MKKWFRVAIGREGRSYGAQYSYSDSKNNAEWNTRVKMSEPFPVPEDMWFEADEIDPNLVPYKQRAFTEATEEELLAVLKKRGVKLARFL